MPAKKKSGDRPRAVYRVTADVNHFKSLHTDSFFVEFDGTRKALSWKVPVVYSLHPLRDEGDVWGCWFGGEVFAVNERAQEILRPFLDQSAEELPVRMKGQKLKVVNVVEVVNCLDAKKSKTTKDLPHDIQKYVFHRQRFTFSLFKIPEQRLTHIFCVEGLNDPEHEFKGSVEANGLRGLRFDKVWSE